MEKRAITKEQLVEALGLQHTKFKGKALGQILVELGYISEEELYSVLAIQLGYPYIKVANCAIDKEVLALVPKETAEKLGILPIDKIGNILTVAALNPLDNEPLQAIEKATGLKIKIFVSSPKELRQAQADYYGTGGL